MVGDPSQWAREIATERARNASFGQKKLCIISAAHLTKLRLTQRQLIYFFNETQTLNCTQTWFKYMRSF